MEHEAVRLTLRVLDRICQKIERSEKLGDSQHVDQLLEFFTVFVDKCHHGKEEELLFPALEKVGVNRDKGFELIETEKVGPGRHEEFHKMLDHLESVYLK
jgi:hemerythrin-like domain-containing protein